MAEKEKNPASADSMFRATAKSNGNKTEAYYYGNIGDSIERRLPDGGPNGGSYLGGGSDIFQGYMGAGSSMPAVGFGNYFGGGAGGGFGGRYGPFVGGLHSGGFKYLNRFSTNASFNHSIIAACMMAYLGYGVVRNIIDLYTDFATEDLQITHPDKSAQKFFNAWATKVNLTQRVHNIFMNLFVCGQAFIHRRWANLTPQEKRAMKRAEGSQRLQDGLLLRLPKSDTHIDEEVSALDAFFARKSAATDDIDKSMAAPKTRDEELLPENKDKKIPWGYTALNPLQMEMRGKRIQGQNYWVMALDRKDTMDIARGMGYQSGQDLGATEVNFPREFVNKVQKYQGPGAGYVAEIKLSKEELSVIQDRKFDWWDWSIPFVYPALGPLYFKDCLRNMEIKACSSVINSIFLFKLGDMKNGMPAEDEHFERLADMLQMPGQALNILWNEAIQAEVVQADVKGIFDPKKHESADRDILTALGVPEVLLGGKGGNFTNSFVSVATVLERLESARERLIQWLMGEFKIIADAMGFRKLPEVKFGKTSLRDRKAEQQFLLGLLDRGIVSADTVLKEANTSYEVEKQKQEEEKTKILGPFVKEPPKPMTAPKPGVPAPGQPKQKEAPKTPNGRPPGSNTGPTGKQDNPRGPKGQGLASNFDLFEEISIEAREALDAYENFITSRYLKAKGLKYVKEAPQKERDRLEQLVYNAFSYMPSPKPQYRSDDFILNILESNDPAETKADVLSSYHRKLANYKDKFGKDATREMRRQFMVSAWTECAIDNISGI